MRESLRRLLAFYGLELTGDGELRVVETAVFEARAANWLSRSNHNHLRITRILKSLRLAGLEEEARAFYRYLEGLYGREKERISETTFGFWRGAAQIAP